MVISLNNPERYPKLISKFERETGKHAVHNDMITEYFGLWLNQKIKYKDGFICDNPDCAKFGQEFNSKKSLIQHNTWHNRQYKTLSKDDPITKFFMNYMSKHTYLPKKIYKIYRDKINHPKDKINIIRAPFRSLINQHMRLGALERYSHTNYKINKEMLNDNGELIGKST